MHGTLPPHDESAAPPPSVYADPTLPIALKVIAAISTLCGWIAAAMIASAVGVTCQMIYVRQVMNGSTTWQTEAVIYLVISATLIGLPYVQKLRGHVNVDALPRLLPAAVRFPLAVLIKLLGIAIVGVMFWYSIGMWHEAWDWGERSDTVWGIKLWIPYLALPLGFGLYALQLLGDLFLLLGGHESPFGIEEADRAAAASKAARTSAQDSAKKTTREPAFEGARD